MTIALILSGCSEKKDQKPKTTSVDTVNGSSDKPGVSIRNECIVNEFGVRVKGVVKKEGVQCFSDWKGSVNGKTAEYFHPYFVFDVRPRGSDNPDMYLIGTLPNRGSIIGWIQAKDFQEWSHRVALKMKKEDDGLPTRMYVFRNSEDLIKWKTAMMRGEEPSVNPIAQTPDEFYSETLMPWPIIEKKNAVIEGKHFDLYRIAFLGSVKEGSNPLDLSAFTSESQDNSGNEEYRQTIREAVKKLDVVFVIDVTGSMSSVIEAAKSAAKRIAGGVSTRLKSVLPQLGFEPDIAFGMVAYRDFSDGKPYKIYPLVDDINKFNSLVSPVSATGGGDEREAVYEGVNAAIDEIKWRGVLQWGRAGLSTRMIVLLGDHSAHEPSEGSSYKVSESDLVKKARTLKKNITIFSICCNSGGSESERERHYGQFSRLAEKTGGTCYNLNQADAVISRIEHMVTGKLSNEVNQFVKFEEAIELGTEEELVAEEKISYQRYTVLMEILDAAGVEIDRLRPDVPAFSTGWVVSEYAGTEVAQKEVYASREEVSKLMSELDFLRDVLIKKPDTVAEIKKKLLDMRLGEESFFWPDEEWPTDMETQLISRFLPVTKNSILKKTRDQIYSMDEFERSNWIEEVGKCVAGLGQQKGDKSRFPWTQEYGWLLEAILL